MQPPTGDAEVIDTTPSAGQESGVVCLALALYGVAPTITLAAVLVLARAQRGRAFLAGVALGAAMLVPAAIALESLVG